MAQGKLKAKELVSHRFPLKDLIEVWSDFIDKKQEKYVQVLFVSEDAGSRFPQ
jgi:threonine dehydrogenase-like Zn-dependent dehydrogenase